MDWENRWRGKKKRGGNVGSRGGWGRGEAMGRERKGEEGVFNLLIQFLPMPVTLLLGEGGQMERAAQNTQTKSHFLSLSPSLSLSLCLASLCLSLAPSLTPSPSFFHLSTAFFSLFVTRLMTDSRSPRPSARWKWNLSNPPLMEFVKLNRVFVLNCLHNQTFETQNSRTLRTKAHSKHSWLMNVKCDGVYPGWVNCLVLFF